MPRVAVTATHRLGREEAQRRLKERLRVVRDGYGSQLSDLHEEWNDSSLSFGFKVVGMRVGGTIRVEAGEVHVAIELPFAAMIFKSLVEKRIRSEVGNLLS